MRFWKHASTVIAALFSLAQLENATAQLTAFGPIAPTDGFPTWYSDTISRLAQCIDDPALCGLGAPIQLVSPGAAFPLNFGGTFPIEFPFWRGLATMTSNANGKALLDTALFGTFANGVTPLAGDQVVVG